MNNPELKAIKNKLIPDDAEAVNILNAALVCSIGYELAEKLINRYVKAEDRNTPDVRDVLNGVEKIRDFSVIFGKATFDEIGEIVWPIEEFSFFEDKYEQLEDLCTYALTPLMTLKGQHYKAVAFPIAREMYWIKNGVPEERSKGIWIPPEFSGSVEVDSNLQRWCAERAFNKAVSGMFEINRAVKAVKLNEPFPQAAIGFNKSTLNRFIDDLQVFSDGEVEDPTNSDDAKDSEIMAHEAAKHNASVDYNYALDHAEYDDNVYDIASRVSNSDYFTVEDEACTTVNTYIKATKAYLSYVTDKGIMEEQLDMYMERIRVREDARKKERASQEKKGVSKLKAAKLYA